MDFGFDTFKSGDHNDIKIEFDANAEFGNNNIEWNEYENNFGKDAAFKWWYIFILPYIFFSFQYVLITWDLPWF